MRYAQNKNVKKTVNSNMPAAIMASGLFNAWSFKYMGIFNKKPAKELPPLFSEAELNGASYEQVIDFLVSVNAADFKKVIKVAELQRKAHIDMAKVTGMTMDEPQSIFDMQTIEARAEAHNATDTEAGNFLDDDDELTRAFMDDDEPTTPPKSPAAGTTKINVSGTDGPLAS